MPLYFVPVVHIRLESEVLKHVRESLTWFAPALMVGIFRQRLVRNKTRADVFLRDVLVHRLQRNLAKHP